MRQRGAAPAPIAALTIPETIDMMIEPSTAHQNPSIVTPTSNRLSESHDASSMNSQLITSARKPNDRMVNGSASVCTTGLMEALSNAMNNENAAMPRMGGCPTACMPGNSSTMTAAATVSTSHRIKNEAMVLIMPVRCDNREP